jgi:hypothetical protein
MMTVEKEKVPKGFELYYKSEVLYNEGYMWANCETAMPNHNCYYISQGCTGCTVQPLPLHHITAIMQKIRR